MKSDISHLIKHRDNPNDEFYTPIELVKTLIKIVPIEQGNSVLDNAYGTGNFYNNYPDYVEKYYSREFEKWDKKVDWIITNPPYSLLNKWWFDKTHEIVEIGYAYLIGQNNFTAKRIEKANNCGFGLTKIHMCKIFKWYGLSYFTVFEKGKDNIISYDRIVWK